VGPILKERTALSRDNKNRELQRGTYEDEPRRNLGGPGGCAKEGPGEWAKEGPGGWTKEGTAEQEATGPRRNLGG